MDLNKLKELAAKYNGYLNGDILLYDHLNELSPEEINSLKSKYEKDAIHGYPVNLLRYIILILLESQETVTSETIDKLKKDLELKEIDKYGFLDEETKQNFLNYPEKQRSFFTNWKNAGSILFPFFYADELKKEVNKVLENLLRKIIEELNLEDVEIKKFDFLGPRNQGSGRIWGAIFPKDKQDHKHAYQLYFNINHKGLEGGIAKGKNLTATEPEDIEPVASVEKLISLLKEKKDKWQRLNGKSTAQSKPQRQLEEFKIPLNQIFYGPPGTGKTYHTIAEAVKIVEELSDVEFESEYLDRSRLKAVYENYVRKGQIAFTTFHQSMSYEDFVEGIKPGTVETGEAEQKQVTVTYEVKDGIFKELCRNAEGYLNIKKKNSSDFIRKNFVLIVDEINRGNISQIFGELITLLEEDKRKGNPEALELLLPYSQRTFGVPGNLYLVGTMNTADRSVETLDTALRRRFMFSEMPPREDLLSPEKAVYNLWETYSKEDEKDYIRREKILYDFLDLPVDGNSRNKILQDLEENPDVEILEDRFVKEGLEIKGVNLKKLVRVINHRIEKLLDRDHAIGHAYFMQIYKAENPSALLKQTFQKNIIPLLQEYFYGDYGKIGLVLGEAFVKSTNSEKLSFARFNDVAADIKEDYESRPVYYLTGPNDWDKRDFISIYE